METIISMSRDSREDSSEEEPSPKYDKWKVIAASVRGLSHEKTGQPCQDANEWKITSDGILVAAVADGAGSAALGEVGSEIASKIAVSSLCAEVEKGFEFNEENARQVLKATLITVIEAVQAEAETRQVELRDLATTLILIIAHRNFAVAIQVGDGAAVISDSEGQLHSLTVPSSGEYINETTFVISPNALETAQIGLWQGAISQVAAFSDGLQMLALKIPEGTPHQPFFNPLFAFSGSAIEGVEANEKLATFLNSPRIQERADDDLTLLIARVIE